VHAIEQGDREDSGPNASGNQLLRIHFSFSFL
jgi:hypothetical protein